jgi:hypothetical protein
MEEIDGLEVDLDRLPEDLRPLAPMIRRWAVAEGEDRDRRLEQASTEELADFWLAVSPQLPAINAYLEQAIEGQETNEAIVLAATAEAALEASGVIERRTGAAP